MKTKLLILALFLSVQYASAQSLNINVLLEGYIINPAATSPLMRTPLSDYVTGSPGMSDFIFISLYKANCDATPVQRQVAVLFENSHAQITLSSSVTAGNYWIRVQHKNHIDVWSQLKAIDPTTSNDYDFVTPDFTINADGNPGWEDPYNPSQAHIINNANNHNGMWAMFAGDVDDNCGVESPDMTLVENGVGLFGYYDEDVNGDGEVGSLDMTFIENNSNAGVFCSSPCDITSPRKANTGDKNYGSEMELLVSPNPGSDNIEVLTNRDQCMVKLTNALGEVVYQEQMNNQTNIKTANFPRGIYFLTIERDGNVQGKKKIVLQ